MFDRLIITIVPPIPPAPIDIVIAALRNQLIINQLIDIEVELMVTEHLKYSNM